MNLSQVVQGFFVVRRTRLAATPITNYRYCFDKLLACFGPDHPFTKITTGDVRDFLSISFRLLLDTHLHRPGVGGISNCAIFKY